ncbi:DUF998 domain-containing protein [Actinoplanes sp. CA-252034]|uniref:DUF998 domain-containing protein n=1 Tax=Actinoplanes sp. CA-252034 TaxID=3239906 RepID=UPI003D96B3C2
MFLSRGVLVGAWCWVVAAPLFVVANVVVGAGWAEPGFDWAFHNVSDLGNVGCGVWDVSRPRYVCSPGHDVMNAAFVVTAVLLVVGLFLVRRLGAVGRGAWWLMASGAVGLGLAGLFPADVDENWHVFGAVLVFVAGNAGLVLAGWGVGGWRGWVTSVSGVVALVAAVLFLRQVGLGVGVGAVERLAVFPLSVWACAAGVDVLVRGRVVAGGEVW